MSIDEIIRNKLKLAVEQSGLSQLKIAEKAGIDHINLNRILSGKRKSTSPETLNNIAKALNISLSYLFGESPLPSPEKPDFLKPVEVPEVKLFSGAVPVEEINPDNMVMIPLMETKAAATPAVLDISSEKQEGFIPMPADIACRYEEVRAYRVIGDSMYPELHDGDIVAVSMYVNFKPDLRGYNRNKIYLCNIDDSMGIGHTLKKIRIVEDRYLTLISVNHDYEPMVIDLNDEEKGYNSPLAGVVVWSSRRY